jgi:acetylglutamate kinase
LKNSAGELLPYIHTHKEMEQPLESLEYDFLALGKTLLEKRPGVHLSVTSPINLLQEIFTVKGAGTLFRKGSVIESFCETETLDADRLQNLFETSFGKQLTNKAFLENVAYAYVEQDYRGAVLLEKHPNGLYLSKFAVDREARGEGLALELWREVARHHPAFFWRSKTTNSFNAWYRNQADGYHISEPWQIFWRGVPAPAISSIIEFCHTRAEDFSAR